MREMPRHVSAYEFYRDMPKRSLVRVAKKVGVSETSITRWSKEFRWQNRIVLWDNAIREGVEEGAVASVVETRIKEIEQLDRGMDEINKLKPLIFSALESCLHVNPETGKKELEIIPKNTQDMTALYNAMSRLNTNEVKIIELGRKIRGEVDKVEHSGTLVQIIDNIPDDGKHTT